LALCVSSTVSTSHDATLAPTDEDSAEDPIYQASEDEGQTKTNPTAATAAATGTTEKEILTLDEHDNEKYMAQIMFMQTEQPAAATAAKYKPGPGLLETSVYLPHTDPHIPIFQTASSVENGGADKAEMIHPQRGHTKSAKLSSNFITFS
jgi:hypothetical protein